MARPPGGHCGDRAYAYNKYEKGIAAADKQLTNDAFMAKAGELVPIFASAGCKPVSTLRGVTRLFQPGIMIEIEATAVA